MSFNAISTVLVHERLRTITSVKQVWLADDAKGAGTVNGNTTMVEFDDI